MAAISPTKYLRAGFSGGRIRHRHWLGVLGAVMLVINFYASWHIRRASPQPQRARRRDGSSVAMELPSLLRGKHVGDPVMRSFKDSAQAPSPKSKAESERAHERAHADTQARARLNKMLNIPG